MTVNYFMNEQVKELEEEIKVAREAYYNLEPTMSDQEYDAKIEKLKSLNGASKELAEVGAPVPKNSLWKKTKHDIPMGSLNKVNSEKEFREWCSSRGNDFVISEKLDGSSMSLVYQDGELIQAITRGDGLEGEDVLENALLVSGVKKNIDARGRVLVRGEIIMKISTFKHKYSDQYANPRNTAAGKIREKKDKNGCKDLDFLAYNMFVNERQEELETYQFRYLQDFGFKTPHFHDGSVEAVASVYHFMRGMRERCDPELDYEFDGMVVRMNSIRDQNELGSKNMRPEGQVAWKFDALASESRMVDVRWSVGTTGRITPVAIIEPVNVGGVVITNVSLHNLGMFKELQLKKGSRVLVSRNNDVIPYLKANLDLEQK